MNIDPLIFLFWICALALACIATPIVALIPFAVDPEITRVDKILCVIFGWPACIAIWFLVLAPIISAIRSS